jgi:hypothetical protein
MPQIQGVTTMKKKKMERLGKGSLHGFGNISQGMK